MEKKKKSYALTRLTMADAVFASLSSGLRFKRHVCLSI
jgi:hypothetical protein